MPQNPKRILVVSQHFWPENFRITDIVQGFTDKGIEVDVLCGLPNYPKGEWFTGYNYFSPRRENYAGADIFRSGEVRRKNNTSLRIFLNYVSFPIFSIFSLPRLHGRKYDAVFCYETSPVLMMLPAIIYAKTHKLPLTTYVLDLWPDNLYSVLPIKNKFLRKVITGVSNWFYKKSTRLIAMSDALKERLVHVTSTAKHAPKISVIPQYCEDFYAKQIIDNSLCAKFCTKHENGKAYFNILFAGNISPAQDLECLVKAMKIVHKKGHLHVRVLIVGDGMSRDALQKTVQDENLANAFVFCGMQPPEDIPKWTTLADALFAALSKSANLGLTVPAKITSYFASARPLLVCADGEARRVSKESGAALTCPAGNHEMLAENILTLAQMSKENRLKMGEHGFRAYSEKYNREQLLKQLEKTILGDG